MVTIKQSEGLDDPRGKLVKFVDSLSRALSLEQSQIPESDCVNLSFSLMSNGRSGQDFSHTLEVAFISRTHMNSERVQRETYVRKFISSEPQPSVREYASSFSAELLEALHVGCSDSLYRAFAVGDRTRFFETGIHLVRHNGIDSGFYERQGEEIAPRGDQIRALNVAA